MPKTTSKTSAEDKLQYVLSVLSYADLPQPDYQAIAKTTGQSSANNAQKKFKAYIEQAGFSLVDRQIVRPGSSAEGEDEGNANDNDTATKTPSPKPRKSNGSAAGKPSSSKKTSAKKASRKTQAQTMEDSNTPTAKKRKFDQVIELSDDEDEQAVKVENGDEMATDGNAGEEGEDGEGTDHEDDIERERTRRSRGRSRTVKPEDFA